MAFNYDLFISHASQDKVGFADPLVRALEERGFKIWYDRQQIRLGDDFRRKMEEGLAESAFGVIILSPSFRKAWPEAELSALLGQEALFGEKRILPVLYQIDREQAARLWPFLASRSSVQWSEGLATVVQQIHDAVRPRTPAPCFTDEQSRALSLSLDTLYEQRSIREESGEDTSDLDGEIVRIKREMREGGRLRPGDRLAHRYKLLELLGQGGFGQVWKAYAIERRGLVAVKVLHGQYSDDKSRRERFFRGARQMARLQDVPGIVDIIDEECHDGGYHFFVMEHVAGGDFRQAVLSGKLSREDRLQVVLDVGQALEAAHQRGIVHRDVKPANILLSSAGPKLTDFDLVQAADTTGATRANQAMGSYFYAAPELMLDASQSTASADIYGLGMTALFAIHGADFPGDAVFSRSEFLAALNLDEKLHQVLARAIEPEAESRWPSVTVFCQELQAASKPSDFEEEPSKQAPGRKPRKPQTLGHPSQHMQGHSMDEDLQARRRRLAFLVTGGVFLVATVFLVRWFLSSQSPVFTDTWFQKPGQLLIEPELAMRFRYIPPGTFIMGSPEDEPGRWDHEIQRELTLAQGYWLGETEVTQEQWYSLMGTEPSYFNHCGPTCPVESVSWYDAIAFANTLSNKTGLQPCYAVEGANGQQPGEGLEDQSVRRLDSCNGYRLPTEAEWEHAARAGTKTALYTGGIAIKGGRHAPELDKIAWYVGNSRAEYEGAVDCSDWSQKQYADLKTCGPQPVGQRDANPWKLRDMLGNVWEWCEDEEGTDRVIRGGSWIHDARFVRAAARVWRDPSYRNVDVGFRLSRGQAPAGKEIGRDDR